MAKGRFSLAGIPVLFGFAIILMYILISVILLPINNLISSNQILELYASAFSNLIVILVFILLIWKLKWLEFSGLISLGNKKGWLITIGLLVYLIPLEIYAFTGALGAQFPSGNLSMAIVIRFFTGSVVEEIMFRALVLVAMIIAWGDTKKGVYKSVILSSVLFGMMHMLNIGTNPLEITLFQSFVVMLPAIFYATLVVISRSIWPSIVIHWLTNVAVNIIIMNQINYIETARMWIIFALGLIPLVIMSFYLIWRMPEKQIIQNIR